MDYIEKYLREAAEIASKIDRAAVARMVGILKNVRAAGGRLFILGVGGSAGNASHAVNDFRKIAGMEAYAPTDNVSELTARVNDEGWETTFVNWLKGSRLGARDALLVFSVGGGNLEKRMSLNIVEALKLAKEVGAKIVGVVGRDGGYTREAADACVLVPVVNPETVTAHSEAFQGVVWHAIVNHPDFKVNPPIWESMK